MTEIAVRCCPGTHLRLGWDYSKRWHDDPSAEVYSTNDYLQFDLEVVVECIRINIDEILVVLHFQSVQALEIMERQRLNLLQERQVVQKKGAQSEEAVKRVIWDDFKQSLGQVQKFQRRPDSVNLGQWNCVQRIAVKPQLKELSVVVKDIQG